MDPGHPATAKRTSRQVSRLPFGDTTLDGRFRGIPVGSSVLLAGAPDAGPDAFAYTLAAQLMRFEHGGAASRHVGEQRREAIPDAVEYVTFEHVRSDHTVNSALDGCIYFYANDEGTSAAKTMRIGEFGGALSRRHQVVYRTQVGERGFTVSTARGL